MELNGPWKIAGYAGEHDESGAHIVDKVGDRVASTSGGLRHNSPREDWQNYWARARAVASVPELIAALESQICHACSNRVGWTGRDHEVVRIDRLLVQRDWRTCHACQPARAVLAFIRGPQEG